MAQVVFSGKPSSANKNLFRLRDQGFKIVRSRRWIDGTVTYVLEKNKK